MSDEQRPFEGIRVIDCTHVLAGPFAAYQLALLGADVIKVEHPEECDQSREDGADAALSRGRMGTGYLTQGSNKRSVTLDLKTSEGQAILKRLVATADVFVENYRAGALAALGLGPADFAEFNPRLIYCSMTAFGQTGPRGSETAYDQVIQAMSGLMACTGTPETAPVKIGSQVIDYATGTMCAFALASALFQRERTGRGQHIDSAMLDVSLMLLGAHLTGYRRTGREPTPDGNVSRYASNSCYDTADGQLMVGASNRRQFRRLCAVLGLDNLAGEADNEVRHARFDTQYAAIAEKLRARSAADWEVYLQARHIPAGRVRTLAECLEDAQLAHRAVTHEHAGATGVDGPFTVPKAAFKFAHGGPRVDTPPPALGEHDDEVLAELGLAPAEVEALRAAGIVRRRDTP